MHAMQRIHEKHAGKGVTVLGVNVWERNSGPTAFAVREGSTYPVLLRGDDLAKSHGLTGIPHIMVISKNGGIVQTWGGWGPGIEPELNAAIEKALGS
jgi:hypothetical protein